MALLDLTYERFLSKINAANGTNLTMDQVSFSEPRSNTNTNLGSGGYNYLVLFYYAFQLSVRIINGV